MQPGEYGLVTLHRPALVDDPALLTATVEGLKGLAADVSDRLPGAPAHAAAPRRAGLEAGLPRGGSPAEPAARLPRLPRPAGRGPLPRSPTRAACRRRPPRSASAASRCATRPSGPSRSSSARTPCSARGRTDRRDSVAAGAGAAGAARSRSGTARPAPVRPRRCCRCARLGDRSCWKGSPSAASSSARRSSSGGSSARTPTTTRASTSTSVDALEHGQRLGEDVFAPQPPGFYLLLRLISLAGADSVRGFHMGDGRRRDRDLPRGVPARPRARRPARRASAAALLTIAPPFTLFAHQVLADVPPLALSLLAFWLAWEAQRRRSRRAGSGRGPRSRSPSR